MKLEFGEGLIGRGCGVRRLLVGLVVLDRHGGFPMQLATWFTALPAVQNGWTFSVFLILLAVWLCLRRR